MPDVLDVTAYRATAYEAAGAVVRIGRRSAAATALLRRMGVAQAGFVTAWNPMSRRTPPGRNARMQRRLHEMTRGLPRAEGHGRARGWCEAHLLLGADPRRLRVIARRFRQAAIVVLRRGAPARLILL
jgi:hypothetical protein